MTAVARRRADILAALRAERLQQGVSQRRLGATFGASQSSLGQWERRVRTPDAWTVRQWCAALGVRVPADVEVAFRPDIPRCPSRPAYERHRKRGETCTTCLRWFNEHRRQLRAEKRAQRDRARRGEL